MNESPANAILLQGGHAKRRDMNEYAYGPVELTADGAVKVAVGAAPGSTTLPVAYPRGPLPLFSVPAGGTAPTIVLGEAISGSQATFSVAYADVSTAAGGEATATGSTNGVTPATLLAAPASGYARLVSAVFVCNNDSILHTVTVTVNAINVVKALALKPSQSALLTAHCTTFIPPTTTVWPCIPLESYSLTGNIETAFTSNPLTVSIAYADIKGQTVTYGRAESYINNATPNVLLTAAAGRMVYSISVCNGDSVAHQLTLTSGIKLCAAAAIGVSQVLTLGPDGIVLAPVTTDHGLLTGLADDDHLQYALLAGRAGGQTLYGGTAAGNNLALRGTSNATVGRVDVKELFITDAAGNPPNQGDFYRNGDNLKFKTSSGVERVVLLADGTPALGDTIYRAAAQFTRLAGNITTTQKFLSQTGDGANSAAPSWTAITLAGLPQTDHFVGCASVAQAIAGGGVTWYRMGYDSITADSNGLHTPVALTGTMSGPVSSTQLNGVGTDFVNELAVGEVVLLGTEIRIIASITDADTATMTSPWTIDHAGVAGYTAVDRVTIATTGLYAVAFRATVLTALAPANFITARLTVNGTQVAESSVQPVALSITYPVSSNLAGMFRLTAGQIVRVDMRQNSGNDMSVASNTYNGLSVAMISA